MYSPEYSIKIKIERHKRPSSLGILLNSGENKPSTSLKKLTSDAYYLIFPIKQ